MRKEQKNKSRAKLYNLIQGVNSVGTGGQGATSSVTFTDNPTAAETIIFGATNSFPAVTFTFVASASTENEVTIGAGLTNTIDNLITKMLAHSVTGAWGYLHPIDATAAVNTGGTDLDVTYFPGTWANSIVISGTAETDSITQPAGGTAVGAINLDYKTNAIDTTGSAADLEYYNLPDGEFVGQEQTIIVETLAASDTPTILGNYKSNTTAYVQLQFDVAEEFARLVWTGTYWKPMDVSGNGAFTASA